MARPTRMPLVFWRLIRVLLVVGGPVLSIYLLTVLAIEPLLKEKGDKLLETNALMIRDQVDRIVQHWQSRVESRSVNPALSTLAIDRAKLDLHLPAARVEADILLRTVPEVLRVAVLSRNGETLFTAGIAQEKEGGFPPKWLDRVAAGKKARVFPRLGQVRRKQSVWEYVTPILEGETCAGFLAFTVDASEVHNLLLARRDGAGLGSFGTLFDEQENLLASSFEGSEEFALAGSSDAEMDEKLSGKITPDAKAREILLKQAGLAEKLAPSQEAQVFWTQSTLDDEKHRAAAVRLRNLPWVIVFQSPRSSLYGPLGSANVLILLIGLIASGIAYFAFSPDRRSFESTKTLRPELRAVLVGVLLGGAVFFLRHQVIALAEDEIREEGKGLAAHCALEVEGDFRVRYGLIEDLAEKLNSTSLLERGFRESAQRYRRDFGGTLMLSPRSGEKGEIRGVWLEGDQGVEAEALPALARKISGRRPLQIGLFQYPGGGQGIVYALETGSEGGFGSLFWAVSISELLEDEIAGVSRGDYQVSIVRDGHRYPVFPDVQVDSGLPVSAAKASVAGEEWSIEVAPAESLPSRRYGLVAMIVTILGIVLAGGGTAATYFGSIGTASLREVSSHDDLTGLKNRRAFNELMEREIAIAQRYERPLSLMIIDLDHFKLVNDTMGHGAGDQVLQQAAEHLNKAVRDTDVPFRYGGEEFAVVLAETNLVSATGIAERVRLAIAGTPFHTSQGQVNLTTSVGVTGYRTGESIDEFLTRADMALYRAKAEGRNRVVERPAGWDA